MTIIGLKTGDNGIQGLSPAHTHHHRYPIPTPWWQGFSASFLHFLSLLLCLSFLFFVLCFIIACCFFHFGPHLSQTPFKLFSVVIFTVKFTTHTHTDFLITSLFWLSLTFSWLFFIHIFSESCEMSPHRDKSSVPAKSGSDITDTVANTHTHIQRKRVLWNENDIWLNTVTNVMSSLQGNHEPVTEWWKK